MYFENGGPAAVDEVIVEGCGSLERFELSTGGNVFGEECPFKPSFFLELGASHVFLFFWGTILTDQFRSTVSFTNERAVDLD